MAIGHQCPPGSLHPAGQGTGAAEKALFRGGCGSASARGWEKAVCIISARWITMTHDDIVRLRLGFLGTRASLLRDLFARHGVAYMFIGKAAAVAQGLNATTKDIDVYPSKTPENRARLLAALKEAGFVLTRTIGGRTVSLEEEILAGKDFIQLLEPFDLDIVFAPDGFNSFEEASRYMVMLNGYPFLSVDGIIASKKAAGRARDRQDIPLLESLKRYLDDTKA
jgi:hypothetical protein